MNLLEFENNYGITLQYPLATTGERILAFLIDFIIVMTYVVGWGLIIEPSDEPDTVVYLVLVLPVFFFYNLAMEWFNDGQSVGKMALGIRVMRVDGRPLTGYDLMMRWAFRLIDIGISNGIFAALTIAATPRAQRFGDLLADTTVVQTRQARVDLSRVEQLQQLKDYEPKFPQVVALSDEQMMLVKQCLMNHTNRGNDGSIKALAICANRLRAALGVEQKLDDRAFLEILLKDYVSLTR